MWTSSLAAWQGKRRRSGLRTSAWVAAGAHVRSSARRSNRTCSSTAPARAPHRDYARFLHSASGVALHATLQRPESRGEIKPALGRPDRGFVDIEPRYFISDPSGGTSPP